MLVARSDPSNVPDLILDFALSSSASTVLSLPGNRMAFVFAKFGSFDEAATEEIFESCDAAVAA